MVLVGIGLSIWTYTVSIRLSTALQERRTHASALDSPKLPTISEEAQVSKAVNAILTAWKNGAESSSYNLKYVADVHIIAPSEWEIRDIQLNNNGADARVFVKSITPVGVPIQGNWQFHFAKLSGNYTLYSLTDVK